MAWVFRRPSDAAYLNALRSLNTPTPTLAPTGVFNGFADTAEFVISGQDATGAVSRFGGSDVASFTITPQDATGRIIRQAIAEYASFIITPQDAFATLTRPIQLRAIQETTFSGVAKAG